MLAGEVLFEPGEGGGGTGGGDAVLLNGDRPKLGLNPVGSDTKSASSKNTHFLP
jgi:hypothetical protein